MARYEPDVGFVAALIGDPVRARMLFALMDGREIAASELALRSGASPQAASAHLRKLVEGELLAVRRAGRQRLFRLGSAQIAVAIETLASIAPVGAVVSLGQSNARQRLREARTCYDHIAGRLGVAIAESLVARGMLGTERDDVCLTTHGEHFVAQLGIDLNAVRSRPRRFARTCLDWTERRPHVAGSLGAAILDHVLHERWVRRNDADRSLSITPNGVASLERWFHLRFERDGKLDVGTPPIGRGSSTTA